jgi:iron complex outermembrane receptor protein
MLDLLQNVDPFGIGSSFEDALGFAPNIDIRVQGVPETGFNWRFDDDGNPYFRSSFAPLAGLTTEDFIPYNDPTFTNVMWGAGRGAVLSGLSDQLAASPLDPATAAAVLAAVSAATPTVIGGLTNSMNIFNPDVFDFVPFAVTDFVDIHRMQPTNTRTFEIGYKGIVSNKLQFSIDAYRTEKDNFVGPLLVETPNVFLDPVTLGGALGVEFGTYYATTDPVTQATLDILDNPAFGGNGDGNPVAELATIFTEGAARIPFGTASPVEQRNPDAVLVTYRNFGDIDYYGLDLAFAYHLSHHWDLGGTYSYVSKNFFDKDDVEGQAHDIYLNAPKNKFGASLKFTHPNHNVSTKLRFRYIDAFDMSSPFVGLTVDQYEVFDFNIGADAAPGIRFNLSVQNVFDNKHFEFVGAPEIGRLAILRGTYSF